MLKLLVEQEACLHLLNDKWRRYVMPSFLHILSEGLVCRRVFNVGGSSCEMFVGGQHLKVLWALIEALVHNVGYDDQDKTYLSTLCQFLDQKRSELRAQERAFLFECINKPALDVISPDCMRVMPAFLKPVLRLKSAIEGDAARV